MLANLAVTRTVCQCMNQRRCSERNSLGSAQFERSWWNDHWHHYSTKLSTRQHSENRRLSYAPRSCSRWYSSWCPSVLLRMVSEPASARGHPPTAKPRCSELWLLVGQNWS